MQNAGIPPLKTFPKPLLIAIALIFFPFVDAMIMTAILGQSLLPETIIPTVIHYQRMFEICCVAFGLTTLFQYQQVIKDFVKPYPFLKFVSIAAAVLGVLQCLFLVIVMVNR